MLGTKKGMTGQHAFALQTNLSISRRDLMALTVQSGLHLLSGGPSLLYPLASGAKSSSFKPSERAGSAKWEPWRPMASRDYSRGLACRFCTLLADRFPQETGWRS